MKSTLVCYGNWDNSKNHNLHSTTQPAPDQMSVVPGSSRDHDSLKVYMQVASTTIIGGNGSNQQTCRIIRREKLEAADPPICLLHLCNRTAQYVAGDQQWHHCKRTKTACCTSRPAQRHQGTVNAKALWHLSRYRAVHAQQHIPSGWQCSPKGGLIIDQQTCCCHSYIASSTTLSKV